MNTTRQYTIDTSSERKAREIATDRARGEGMDPVRIVFRSREQLFSWDKERWRFVVAVTGEKGTEG